jgi:hypothetical protein
MGIAPYSSESDMASGGGAGALVEVRAAAAAVLVAQTKINKPPRHSCIYNKALIIFATSREPIPGRLPGHRHENHGRPSKKVEVLFAAHARMQGETV